MAQITSGLRSVLSSPAAYELFQNALGAQKARKKIVDHFIRPFDDMRILDMGCGTSEILSFLPSSVTYVGYDISADYIARARKRFGDRGEFHSRLLQLDEANSLAPFDLVMAIGVLHHMEDHEARACLEIAKAVLKPGGRVLTIDPCFAKGQHPIAHFLISKDRGQNVRNAEGYSALGRKVFAQVKGTLSHQDWIPYTHWAMEMS
jgi:SAM-dependent methyltransferase